MILTENFGPQLNLIWGAGWLAGNIKSYCLVPAKICETM